MAYTSFKDFYYKVVVRGPLFTQSGYGEYARNLYRVLSQYDEFDITVQATPWGNTPFIMDTKHPDYPILTKGIERVAVEIQQKIKYNISFQIQLPDEWDSSVADFNVGVTAATEVDRITKEWAESCNKMNLIIAMSEHTKKTLLSSPIEIKTPIIVVGSYIRPETIDESSEVYPIEFPNEIQDIFLHVGQLTPDPSRDRKNTYGLIYAFKQAFHDDPTKALVLKVNLGRNTKIDRANTYGFLKKFVDSTVPNSKAKVYLLHGQMTPKQIGSLYRHPKMRAFISLTRGEGFGLPFLEAAANGLPIIATNHSSYTEFLHINSDPKFIRVPFAMMDVPQQYVDNKIIPQGSKWAQVDHSVAIKTLQNFCKKGYSVPNEWASQLKKEIREKFTLNNLKDGLADQLVSIFPEKFKPEE